MFYWTKGLWFKVERKETGQHTCISNLFVSETNTETDAQRKVSWKSTSNGPYIQNVCLHLKTTIRMDMLYNFFYNGFYLKNHILVFQMQMEKHHSSQRCPHKWGIHTRCIVSICTLFLKCVYTQTCTWQTSLTFAKHLCFLSKLQI